MNQTQVIGLGMMLVFVGMLVIIAGSFFGAKEKANIKSAGIVFIGPFPLAGFANDKRLYYILMALGVALFFVFYFLFKYSKP